MLDRHCIRCHGLGRQAGRLSLLGTPTKQFNEAYDNLTGREGLLKLAYRNASTDISQPGDYGARAGKLAGFLLKPHREKAKLDVAGYTRLVEWLDLNGQYYGDYSFQRHERRKPSDEGVKALRAHVAQSCNSCHAGMSDQPLAALVNVAEPRESRALQAPLATGAGGWGQCKQRWQNTGDAGYTAMQEKVVAATGE